MIFEFLRLGEITEGRLEVYRGEMRIRIEFGGILILGGGETRKNIKGKE